MKHYTKLKQFEPTYINVIQGRSNFIECSEIFTFDIETTSIWEINGKVRTYGHDMTEEMCNENPHKAFCYIWQFGINSEIYYGRELSEFFKFLHNVILKRKKSDAHMIIWVHNLSYEFNFLREYFEKLKEPVKMFARTERIPIKFESMGMEWRCSYMLSRKSLENWGDEMGIPKLIGNLDYTKFHSPKTKLTKKELEYCARDCIVVYHGIKQFVKEYGSQKNIPLTQTGRVRRVVKNICKQNIGYLKKVTHLQPSTEDEYYLLRSVFAGGSTGANYLNANKTLENVASYDIASDYPYQMIAQKYPATKFHEVNKNKKVDFEKFAYIYVLELTNFVAKKSSHYLPSSKCQILKGAKLDNGKVISAKKIIYTCTEQDYMILHDGYNFKEKIIKLYQSRKKYLPTFYVDYILTLYEKKTKLKGIKGKEDEYKRSKEFINSLYGMMVMDILQDNVTYDNEWLTDVPEINCALEEMQEKFFKNFVAYQWGCWVTAYARRTLWNVIYKLGDDHIYHDTDSAKFLNPSKYGHMFEQTNEAQIEHAKKAMEYHGFSFDRIAPTDSNGCSHPIGVFEKEKSYKKFKTLGAKKYAYTYDDDVIHVTVSGVPKSNAIALNSLDGFRDGFVFPKNLKNLDGVDIAKNNVQYIEDAWYPTCEDGYIPRNKYSTVIRPTSYKLGLTDDYKFLLTRGKIKNQLK